MADQPAPQPSAPPEGAEGVTGKSIESSETPIVSRGVRLQKFLADSGVASRRASETVIREGRVTINGEVATELGVRVDPVQDHIVVDGRPVKPQKKMYVALHKPRGYTCSRQDAHADRLVGELLPAEWAYLYPVGRLDRESEGLLFLTNDGEFCLKLTHPRFGVHKRYEVTVRGEVNPGALERFRKGVWSEEEVLRIVDGRILDHTRGETLVDLELAEGRYHEVRRLFASEGHEVIRLMRKQIGPIKLGELRPGRWRTLTPGELKTLLAPA